MALSNVRVPVALSSDPEDVTVALEAAATLWDNGDQKEALRWLGRAAEAASAAGDDLRAVAIQSAAADLRDLAGTGAQASGGTRSQTPPPPPVRPGVRSTGGSSRPPPPLSSPAPPPTSFPSRQRISKPPPPPSARRAGPPPLPPLPPSEPPTASSLLAAMRRSSGPPPLPPPPVSEPESPPPPLVATPAVSRAAPVALPRDSLSTAPPRSEARLRVSVKSSVRDPQLLLVRVLPAGQGAPPGTHEAFLSPSEPGADLLSEPARAIRHG